MFLDQSTVINWSFYPSMVIAPLGWVERNFSNQIKHYPKTKISVEKKGFISSIKRETIPSLISADDCLYFSPRDFHHTVPTQLYNGIKHSST